MKHQPVFLLSAALPLLCLLLPLPELTSAQAIVFPSDNVEQEPLGLIDIRLAPDSPEELGDYPEAARRYGQPLRRGPRWQLGGPPLVLFNHPRRQWKLRNHYKVPPAYPARYPASYPPISAPSAFGQTQQSGLQGPAASQSFSASASFGPSGPSVSFGAAASFSAAGAAHSQSSSFTSGQGGGQSGAISQSASQAGGGSSASQSQSASFAQSAHGPSFGGNAAAAQSQSASFSHGNSGQSFGQSFASSSGGQNNAASSSSSSSQQNPGFGSSSYGNGDNSYGFGQTNPDIDLPLEYVRSNFGSGRSRSQDKDQIRFPSS